MGTDTKNKKGTILIAEDDDLLRDMYALRFEKEGFVVLKAANGEEALEKLKTEKPILLLLDIMMPKIDGFRVLQEVRKNGALKQIPVILLTNLGQEEDIKKGQEYGADDYIVKSNNTPAQVVDRVQKFLSQRAAKGNKK